MADLEAMASIEKDAAGAPDTDLLDRFTTAAPEHSTGPVHLPGQPHPGLDSSSASDPVPQGRAVWAGFLKLACFAAVLYLARSSDLLLALLQGSLFADFSVWILVICFDLTVRKSVGLAEGIGYLFLFWLFFSLGNGRWLPEEPSLLGLAFLSFLLVFLLKIIWWIHKNMGFK